MSTTTQEIIQIALFEVPEKEQAVIQRVITFGASQGKPYALHSDVSTANVLITTDLHHKPNASAVTIQIGDSPSSTDLVLARPLLVTRVMRALDDAAHLLKSRSTTPSSATIPNPVPNIGTADINPNLSAPAPSVEQPPLHTLADDTSTNESQTVNITPAPQNYSAPTSPAPNQPATVDLQYRYTALVVDDSAAIRKQLEIELRNAHIKAEFAETGEEALEKSAQTTYDLVFLDIVMPGIDGYEVCRQMRSRKAMKKTPIIMLSGKTSPLDEVQGVIAGASTYLTKPVKHEQFQQTLTRVSKWLSNFAR